MIHDDFLGAANQSRKQGCGWALNCRSDETCVPPFFRPKTLATLNPVRDSCQDLKRSFWHTY